ncbi:hypothetical protein [Alteromonas sp. H39]|uniref:hypothetical protein n=1 Tax=Alteromonas sp. H39 TaxID=3389876 RepID=UPI0039DF4F9A
MTTHDDELARLWQAQKVATIDTAQIEKDIRRQTLKQRLYLFLDFACLIPVVIFFIIKWNELSSAAATMILVLLVVTTPIFVYMARLRWLAASGFHAATANYLDMLIKQMRNNARIAWLTKHSSWTTAVFLLGFYAVLYFMGEVPEERQTKALLAIVITSVAMAGFYQWAQRREARFHKKAEELLALKQEQNHDDMASH